jgi:hypothetical protein
MNAAFVFLSFFPFSAVSFQFLLCRLEILEAVCGGSDVFHSKRKELLNSLISLL